MISLSLFVGWMSSALSEILYLWVQRLCKEFVHSWYSAVCMFAGHKFTPFFVNGTFTNRTSTDGACWHHFLVTCCTGIEPPVCRIVYLSDSYFQLEAFALWREEICKLIIAGHYGIGWSAFELLVKKICIPLCRPNLGLLVQRELFQVWLLEWVHCLPIQ